MGLREYQITGIDRVRSCLRNGSKRVLLYCPTGGGKTEIAGDMIRSAAGKGKRVAFVCNRIELVSQASRRFRKLGLQHGVLQGGNSRAPWENVLVGSIQTIAKRGIEDMDLVIIDEAHACAGSRDYHRMLERWKDVPVIGLSATPFSRGLGKVHEKIGGPVFEEIVIAATIPELIQAGWLVDCDIFGPSEPDLEGVKVVAGDYHQEQMIKATDRPELIGDIVTHWAKHGDDQQTLCFAASIEHSKHIVEQFREMGISAEHVDAYTPENERREIIDGFRDGAFKILSNCSMLAEGFDVPAASVLILARPTKSLVRYIQMVGRVLRPYPGKERALVLDHSGSCRRLGFPTDELPIELDDGSPRVADALQEAKMRESLPKLCAACKYLKPAGVHICPKCGAKPERNGIKAVGDGELEKIERERLEKKAKIKLNKDMTVDQRAEVYGQLKAHATLKGYQSAWASNQYRNLFSVWPNDIRIRYAPERPVGDVVASWIKSQQIRYSKRRQA